MQAVRCNHCVSIKVSGYCPNCLSEVSVCAEKNRSESGLATVRRMSPYDILLTDARAIALCTLIARNTHFLVPSDPPDADDGRFLVTNLSTVDEPPFVFYCSYCTADGTPPGSTSRWTTHTQRTHTRWSATSKPQRQLHWHAIFQVSRRTPCSARQARQGRAGRRYFRVSQLC